MRNVSNSELSTWRQCPRKYHYTYVQQLGSLRSPLSATAMGTAIHARLETKYSGNPAELWGTEVDQTDLTTLSAAEEQVSAVVDNYEEWLADTGEDQRWEVVETEQEHRREHHGVVYTGKLDGVWRDRSTDALWIVDHKTTKADLKTQSGKIAQTTQPTHYWWLLRDRPVRGVMLNVIKRAVTTQTPAYRHEVYRTNAQLDTYGHHLIEWGNALKVAQRRTDIPPPSPQDACGWCEFRVLCTAQDAGEDVRHLEESEFIQIDPMARYQGDN